MSNINSITLGDKVFTNSQRASTLITIDLTNTPWQNNSMTNVFYNCINLTDVTNINQNVTNLTGTFYNCQKLVNVSTLPNNATNMYETFYNCRSIIDVPAIPIGVINMSGTFHDCISLVNAPAIPGSVKSMTNTFYKCTSLINGPVLSNGVDNLLGTFCNCTSLVNAPEIPASVVEMGYYSGGHGTFENCISLTGRINIYSENINHITKIFDGTSANKDVYIPFKNGVNYTKTYNIFTNYGYSPNERRMHGVQLFDINGEEDLFPDFDYTIDENNDVILTRYKGTSDDIIIPIIS